MNVSGVSLNQILSITFHGSSSNYSSSSHPLWVSPCSHLRLQALRTRVPSRARDGNPTPRPLVRSWKEIFLFSFLKMHYRFQHLFANCMILNLVLNLFFFFTSLCIFLYYTNFTNCVNYYVLLTTNDCCVFRPMNKCSAHRSLVEINFLMLKQLFALFFCVVSY